MARSTLLKYQKFQLNICDASKEMVLLSPCIPIDMS